MTTISGLRPALCALGLAGCAAGALEAPSAHPIAFIGDSITKQLGSLAVWFGAQATNWVNAGKSGDTSAMVLSRLDAAVSSNDEACVVLAGTNDLLFSSASAEAIGANIALMVDALRAKQVVPILATVTPVAASYGASASAINARVIGLNAWIHAYALAQHIRVVEYYPSFADSTGSGIESLYIDGIHPNPEGQARMVNAAAVALRAGGFLR